MNDFIFSFIFNIIISIFLIYCGHLIWDYLKDTYTHQKTKDLVNTQINKYKQIVEEMQNSPNNNNTIIQANNAPIDFQNMDDDLTSFMQQQSS